MFKRFFFFALVNIAVVAVILVIAHFFGLETRYLTPNGLNLMALAFMSLLWGFVGSFVSLFMSKWLAKKTMGVQLISQPKNSQENKIVEIVSRIASQAGLKTPEIGIYDSPEVNAFATGWSRNNSLVAVSSGLLSEMSPAEIEGVLAHEMAHIANGDMVTMTLIQGVVNAFVIFFARIAAFAVQKAMGRDNEAIGGFAYLGLSILFEIIFGILASTIVFAFSRWREFGADAGGAKFVGKRNMIAALQKLQKLTHRIDPSQKSFATLKISDRPGFAKFFSSHPPLEKRIEVLESGF